MLRINHFVPFSSTRQIIVFQSWFYNEGIFFINPNVITADLLTGDELPTTVKTVSTRPSKGGVLDLDYNGDNYCKHVQYHGDLDVLLPDCVAPIGAIDGESTVKINGVPVPRFYSNMYPLWAYGACTRTKQYSNYTSTMIYECKRGEDRLEQISQNHGAPYPRNSEIFISNVSYNAKLNCVDTKLTRELFTYDKYGLRTLTTKYVRERSFPMGTSLTSIAGIVQYSKVAKRYGPEQLSLDLERVYNLQTAIQHRLQNTPISFRNTEWDLVSDAMKSINALDSNSLGNAVQLPALRTLGTDMLNIASDLTSAKKLATVAKAVSRAYLIKKYVVDTTISDATELKEALESPAEVITPQSKYVGPPLAKRELPAVDILLKNVEEAMSVLKSSYIKRYSTSYDSFGQSTAPFTGDVRTNVKVVFQPRAYTSAQQAWHDLRKWGLDPSLVHMWDLVPFSFAIDWFLKIGDRLESLGDLTTLTTQYDLIMRSTSYKKTLSYLVGETGSQYSDPRLVGTLAVTDYERRIYRTFPTFQPTIGKINPDQHVVEGTALFVQAL